MSSVRNLLLAHMALQPERALTVEEIGQLIASELQVFGLIEHTQHGYRITERGWQWLGHR